MKATGIKRLPAIIIIAVMLISSVVVTAYGGGVSGTEGGTKIREYKIVLEENDTSIENVPSGTVITDYIATKKSDFETKYNPLKTPEYSYGAEHMTIPSIDSLFTADSYALIKEVTNSTKYDASDDLIAIGDLDNWEGLQIAQGTLTRTDIVTVKYDVVLVCKYKITEGANSVWTQNTDATLTFRADGDFDKFTGVQVDGDVISEDNYTAESGSTVLTLKNEYLKTLSVGKHKLTMTYDDGEAITFFTVKAGSTSPVTGDNANIAFWITLLATSLLGVVWKVTSRNRA